MKRKLLLLCVATLLALAATGQTPVRQKPPRGRWGAEVNTYVAPFIDGAISVDGIYNYAVADWNNRLVDFGPEEPMLAKALSLITGRTYTPAPGRSAAGIAPIAGVSLPEDARRPAGMLVLSPQHGE